MVIELLKISFGFIFRGGYLQLGIQPHCNAELLQAILYTESGKYLCNNLFRP